jgi:hypothetical protein
MAEVGVTDLSPPTPDEIEELATKQLISTLIPQDHRKGIDEDLASIKNDYDIGPEDFETEIDSVGRLKIVLTDEAAEKVAKKSKFGYAYHGVVEANDGGGHYNGYPVHGHEDTFMSIILSGGLLPTFQMWTSTLRHEGGMSPSDDVHSYGSGDTSFTYLRNSSESAAKELGEVLSGDLTHKNKLEKNRIYWNWGILKELGWTAFNGDHYGDFKDQSTLANAVASNDTRKQMTSPGLLALNRFSRIVVSESMRASLIDRLHALGIWEIDGVDIEQLIIGI